MNARYWMVILFVAVSANAAYSVCRAVSTGEGFWHAAVTFNILCSLYVGFVAAGGLKR